MLSHFLHRKGKHKGVMCPIFMRVKHVQSVLADLMIDVWRRMSFVWILIRTLKMQSKVDICNKIRDFFDNRTIVERNF